MATAETVHLGPAHPPKEEAVKAFDEIQVELKKTLQHLRHETNTEDLEEVRIGSSAYGLHLFGKVLIPDHDPLHSYPEKPSSCYFMFRAFIGGDAETAKLHCIHMEEIQESDGKKQFKAIFSQNDPLEWFDE